MVSMQVREEYDVDIRLGEAETRQSRAEARWGVDRVDLLFAVG
jgi:hypothetical protein